MAHQDIVFLVIWFNVRFCLPLTVLIIGFCCMVRLKNTPVVIYINLLVSNLIQFGSMVVWIRDTDERDIPFFSIAIYYCSVMAGLGLRIFITLERYFVIAHPRLQSIKHPKFYVLNCLAWWILCGAIVYPLNTYQFLLKFFVLVVFTLTLFSASVMVFCVARTFRYLPGATSVFVEDKLRVLAALVLLLGSYIELILTTDVWTLLMSGFIFNNRYDVKVVIYMFLLSPFLDLILFAVMSKGPLDKMLVYLFCCKMEETADDVVEEIQD